MTKGRVSTKFCHPASTDVQMRLDLDGGGDLVRDVVIGKDDHHRELSLNAHSQSASTTVADAARRRPSGCCWVTNRKATAAGSGAVGDEGDAAMCGLTARKEDRATPLAVAPAKAT
jgi:hypothetical protein